MVIMSRFICSKNNGGKKIKHCTFNNYSKHQIPIQSILRKILTLMRTVPVEPRAAAPTPILNPTMRAAPRTSVQRQDRTPIVLRKTASKRSR